MKSIAIMLLKMGYVNNSPVVKRMIMDLGFGTQVPMLNSDESMNDVPQNIQAYNIYHTTTIATDTTTDIASSGANALSPMFLYFPFFAIAPFFGNAISGCVNAIGSWVFGAKKD